MLLLTSVTLSRSEGSVTFGLGILRCAQKDSAILLLSYLGSKTSSRRPIADRRLRQKPSPADPPG